MFTVQVDWLQSTSSPQFWGVLGRRVAEGKLRTGSWCDLGTGHWRLADLCKVPLGLRAVAGPWASGLSGHRGPSTCSRTRLGAGELWSIFSHCWREFVRKSRHKTQLSSSSKRDTGTSRSPEWTVCRKLQLGGRLRAAGLSWVHRSFKGFCRPYQPTGLSLRCPAFSSLVWHRRGGGKNALTLGWMRGNSWEMAETDSNWHHLKSCPVLQQRRGLHSLPYNHQG